jgi:hypothetical protein
VSAAGVHVILLLQMCLQAVGGLEHVLVGGYTAGAHICSAGRHLHPQHAIDMGIGCLGVAFGVMLVCGGAMANRLECCRGGCLSLCGCRCSCKLRRIFRRSLRVSAQLAHTSTVRGDIRTVKMIH